MNQRLQIKRLNFNYGIWFEWWAIPASLPPPFCRRCDASHIHTFHHKPNTEAKEENCCYNGCCRPLPRFFPSSEFLAQRNCWRSRKTFPQNFDENLHEYIHPYNKWVISHQFNYRHQFVRHICIVLLSDDERRYNSHKKSSLQEKRWPPPLQPTFAFKKMLYSMWCIQREVAWRF